MNLYDHTSGYMPEATEPMHYMDEEEVLFGETEVTVKGIGYYVEIIHGEGLVTDLATGDELVLSRELEELIVDVAKDKLRK